jgi:hypothetical protein
MSDNAFPLLFILFASFTSLLVWVCAMLQELPLQ